MPPPSPSPTPPHAPPQCCVDGDVLLDADQPDHPIDTYFHKLRVYFEEPRPALQNAFRLYWQAEEWNGEYQIPQCAAGTPPADCVHTLTSRLTGADLLGGLQSPTDPQRLNCSAVTDPWCGQARDVVRTGGRYKLLYMAFHQHSPAVLEGTLYNADTGELICRNAPKKGTQVPTQAHQTDRRTGSAHNTHTHTHNVPQRPQQT